MQEGRPSRTARAVALGRALGVGDLRDPVVAELLPPLDRVAVGLLRGLSGSLGTPWPTAGAAAHAALRMSAVDVAVAGALRTQPAAPLVVVGAGYDARAWRLPVLDGRTVWEVDHPATQERKRAALRDRPPRAAEVVRVPADLREVDLARAMGDVGHDPGVPTVWLCEAVLPYLAPDVVDAVLAAMRSRSAPGSVLVLTTVRPRLLRPAPPGAPTLARAALRRAGEPVLTAEDDPASVRRLAGCGWTARAVDASGAHDWARAAGVRLVGPVLDERLHVAGRG